MFWRLGISCTSFRGVEEMVSQRRRPRNPTPGSACICVFLRHLRLVPAQVKLQRMIPVTDAVRAQRLPIVNVAIILACIAVFVYELTLSLPDLNRFFFDYSVIPASLDA